MKFFCPIPHWWNPLLDEGFRCFTKATSKSATLIAKAIRQEIFDATGLTASAGVSYCKFLAKIASDINKPNGMKVILPHEAPAFLEALPIGKFYGIGKVTASKLQRMGAYRSRSQGFARN
ncbi:MAG: hypothetical protein R2795_16775 [Saprospiraceae bacterium]